ncbi:hypothetical protein [Pseudofrankia inefficax]|uniref:Uncharacterized protein n=1 Tax=Pseudofrankia inefficax (strain DSM 45817 / CECT 9037 / DDB 130130 / EuI1c) TaxID=298654 RepID=E3IZ38_PSEI1|nr:hypothetical protein [Pseudofrankia inefficax]ADP80321.1 hypothetical protein FraEuI1c_2282 [Pseudofrankia inefficax]
MTTEQFSLEPRPYPLCMAGATCSAPGGRPCRALCDFLADKIRDTPAATASLLALNESAEIVGRARPGLEGGLAELSRAETETTRGLERLATFVARRRIAAAVAADRRVAERYASDGPYDRRRRPWWHSWLPVLAVVVAGVFDAWFFGKLFGYLGNTKPHGLWSHLQYWIGYLPAVVLAVALYVTGQELARPVAIWSRRRAWSGKQSPRPVWRVVVPFAVLLLSVVGVVAWVRASLLIGVQQVDQSDTGVPAGPVIPDWTIIVLLVTVSLSAIFIKISCANPDADSARDASRHLAATEKEYDELLSAARTALTRQVIAWEKLRGDLWWTHSAVNDLWARARAVFADLPAPPVARGARPVLPDEEQVDGLLATIPGVPPAFGIMLHVEHAHGAHSPAPAMRRLEELIAQANQQWSPEPEPGEPPGPYRGPHDEAREPPDEPWGPPEEPEEPLGDWR